MIWTVKMDIKLYWLCVCYVSSRVDISSKSVTISVVIHSSSELLLSSDSVSDSERFSSVHVFAIPAFLQP